MPPRISANQNIAQTQYFNKERVRRDLTKEEDFPVVPSKCLPFDYVTGIGGLPRGRITELYGGESSGKSTLAMHLCREDLQTYPDVAVWYFDYERSTARKYAEQMGLLKYADRFHLLDPDTLEQADKICQDMWGQEIFPSIIVCDSIPAMVPADLYGRDMEDTPQIGLQARKLAEMLSKWVKVCADYEIAIVLINQTRTFIQTEKFGAQKARIPGVLGSDKEETPGGKAVKFYSAMRLRLQAKTVIVDNIQNPLTGEVEKLPVANVVKMVAAKNKCAPPFRAGEFHIRFGHGIDNDRTIIGLATKLGHVTKSGANYTLALANREIKCRGEEAFIKKVREDAEAMKELHSLLQWDKIDEITAQSLGTEQVDTATGNISEVSPEEELAGLTVDMIEQCPSFIEKAEVLKLLDNGVARGAHGYTPDGGEQVRAKTLDGLWKKLDAKAQEELKAAIADRIQTIKEATGEAEAPPEIKDVETSGTESATNDTGTNDNATPADPLANVS